MSRTALFNTVRGDIILIVATLLIVAMVGAVFVGLIFTIVRASRKAGNNRLPSGSPPVDGEKPQSL